MGYLIKSNCQCQCVTALRPSHLAPTALDLARISHPFAVPRLLRSPVLILPVIRATLSDDECLLLSVPPPVSASTRCAYLFSTRLTNLLSQIQYFQLSAF